MVAEGLCILKHCRIGWQIWRRCRYRCGLMGSNCVAGFRDLFSTSFGESAGKRPDFGIPPSFWKRQPVYPEKYSRNMGCLFSHIFKRVGRFKHLLHPFLFGLLSRHRRSAFWTGFLAAGHSGNMGDLVATSKAHTAATWSSGKRPTHSTLSPSTTSWWTRSVTSRHTKLLSLFGLAIYK